MSCFAFCKTELAVQIYHSMNPFGSGCLRDDVRTCTLAEQLFILPQNLRAV